MWVINMETYQLISYISKQLVSNKSKDIELKINDIQYKIKFLQPDEKNNINIPSILMIPLTSTINNQLMLEANNLETDDLERIMEQGMYTAVRLATLTSNLPCPILVPLIPSYKDYAYLQQLSKECFDLPKEDKNYRIDEQIMRIIDKTKSIFKSERNLILKDKIFLNGYSSSGVFAQRFALLHPKIIETVCIGGGSSSIPIPTKILDYPIGIGDFNEITGEDFDMKNYLKITFRYYVGEFETKNRTNSRFDDDGHPAPMHDMSYFDRSVPKEVSRKQRELLGKEMFQRAENTIHILKELGIDIEQKIILGRYHNNMYGEGVNELADAFINDTYTNTIKNNKINR